MKYAVLLPVQAKYMKLAATLLRKKRSVYTLQKAMRNIVEIADHSTPATWEKIKSTQFIKWLLCVRCETDCPDSVSNTICERPRGWLVHVCPRVLSRRFVVRAMLCINSGPG